MCDFMIILHIVSSVCNFYSWHWLHNHCCALCTQSYCTHYRWIWFSCPLIWDKCSVSCVVLSDTGWCLLLLRVLVKCRNCEWPASHLAIFAALWISWLACGMIKARASSFKNFCCFSYVLQSLAYFSENKCVQGSTCQLFHKRASLANNLFSFLWCTSCTFDHDCPHHLFLVVKYLFLFQYPCLFRNA